MKVLFDPGYSARPRVCSSSFLVWELIEALIAWRPDVFVYLCYPKARCEPDDLEYLSRHPDRVTLLDVPNNPGDRISEFYMLRNELRSYLNPWFKHTWDIDVVVSSRIPVLKHMMVHSSRSGSRKMPSTRMFIGMEDVPCLPFRDTVPWGDLLYPDTLTSYALADAIIMNGQWTKQAMKPVLREFMTPAWQQRVLSRVFEANSVKLERIPMREGVSIGDTFNVSFVGRITGTRNFGAVAEVFRKQFSYPLGPNKSKMVFAISTNSRSLGAADVGEVDFIDLQMNDRPAFLEFLKKQHVVLNLSTVEDFSMSTWETLKSGVPMIVYDYPWNSFLGDSYPFRCRNEVEVFALLNMFASDYAGMYQRFANWESTYWAAHVADPTKNVTTAEVLISQIGKFEENRRKHFAELGGSYRAQVQALATTPTIDLTAHIESSTMKLEPEIADNYNRILGRTPNTLLLKVMAEELGYRDTNKTGVMTKE